MIVKALFSHLKLIVSITVVISAILYRNELKLYYDIYIREDKAGIYTMTKLAQYDGVKQRHLYLAVLGSVYDVTESKRHYIKGSAYHYFIGKDGSRALLTGDFKDESDEKDHVLDLSCSDLLTLVHWQNTFRKKYVEVGVLIGRYFDSNGQETAYMKEFDNKIEQCQIEKENSSKEDQKYPPCNIAWSADEGTKVWCTTLSGGVRRTWSGVPRRLYTPGMEKPRCVCLDKADQDSLGLIKEYDNCPKFSTQCLVKT